MKIINKIITIAAALAVFPVIITQTFVTIVLSIDQESVVYTLANKIFGEQNQLTGNRLGIEKNLVDFFRTLTENDTNAFNIDIKDFLGNLPEEFNPVKKYVIASLVFMAVGLLITVVIIGCSLFTKAYKTVIGLGLGGAVSFLISIILFGKASAPLLDGSIDLVTSLSPMLISSESIISSLAASLLSGTVNVDTCGLGGAVYGAMIILFGVALWEFAYYITLPKDEKEKLKIKSDSKTGRKVQKKKA